MSKTDDNRAALVKAVLGVNVHQHIGLTLHAQDATKHTAHASFTTSERHLTPTSTLHGGIVNLTQDVVCYLAALNALGDGEIAATITCAFEMIATVLGKGNKIDFHAAVVKKTKSIVFCECRVSCNGKLLAKGAVTKMIIKNPAKESKL